MSPLTLSDGITKLQPGMLLSLPAGPMAKDSTYYQDPEVFNGERFLLIEELKDQAPRPSYSEFTGIEPGNLSWGSGRFTCPGRWYASTEMKLIIATILTRYDVRFPDGQTTRPPNWYFDDAIQPSRKQDILLRSRR